MRGGGGERLNVMGSNMIRIEGRGRKAMVGFEGQDQETALDI